MIIKLDDSDKDWVIDYLLPEKELNLFIIGDIENYGMTTPFQDVWCQKDENGLVEMIYLRYYNNLNCYASKTFNKKEAIEFVKSLDTINVLMGKTEVISELVDSGELKYVNNRLGYFARINELIVEADKQEPQPQLATLNDIDAIDEFHGEIKEFSPNPNRKVILRDSFLDGTGRCYIIKENEELVCTAVSAAENSRSAMVVGVATKASARKKGYASRCTIKLCEEILNEGRNLCLFYDNPKAGDIYKRIGFEDIGRWQFCKLDKEIATGPDS